MDGAILGINYVHGRGNHYILTLQIGDDYEEIRSLALKHFKKMKEIRR